MRTVKLIRNSVTVENIIKQLQEAQSNAMKELAQAKATVKEQRFTLTTINKALRSFGVKVRKKADIAPEIPSAMASRMTPEGRAKLSKAMKKRHAEARKQGYSSYQEMMKAQKT